MNESAGRWPRHVQGPCNDQGRERPPVHVRALPATEGHQRRMVRRCARGWQAAADLSDEPPQRAISIRYGTTTRSAAAPARPRRRDYAKYRAMDLQAFEFMPDAMLVTAADGAIRFINRAGEGLFGYERNELLGRAVEVLIPARFRGAHSDERAAYVTGPRVRPMGLGLDPHALAKDATSSPSRSALRRSR